MTGQSGTPRKGKAMSEREELVKLTVQQIEGIRARQELNIPQESATIYALCDFAIAALSAQPQQEPVAWHKEWFDESGRRYVTLDWSGSEPDGKTKRPLLKFKARPLIYGDTAPSSGVREPDAAHLQTIDERDAAEEAVSDIYYRITGRSPEWSNLFGFEQAIDEIQDAFDLVRAVAKSNTAPQSGVREGMLLNRADVLLAYAYMEERNFPDIAACRVIQQAHEIITRAADQVDAEQTHVRVPVERLEYIANNLPDSYPASAIIALVREMLRAATGKESE